MSTKLTLRLDERLIRRAKAHARQTGKSLSQVVADYFEMLSAEEVPSVPLSPIVRRLRGLLSADADELNDYHAYLERKYR